jgi:hypothetical protein
MPPSERALLEPLEHRLQIDHGLAKQLVLRAHGRPHHVTEGVHVLAAADAEANGVGKRFVDEALGNLAHGIEDLSLAQQQTVEQRRRIALERRPQLRQYLRREDRGHRLTHMGVARRIVRQQYLRAQRLRVVPRPRLRGKGVPILQPRRHVRVSRDHHGAVGEAHDGREFTHGVIDGARIAHRLAAEQIDLVIRNGQAHYVPSVRRV